MVAGSVIVGGDPGIGKTTLLLQTLSDLAKNSVDVLYVTGEESLSQISLGAADKNFKKNLYLLSQAMSILSLQLLLKCSQK